MTAATPTPTKPKRTPPTPEQVGRQTALLDGVLVALVLVLAFFLGSFAARNTDLWMRLATGRLIAHGGYSFGTDPFSYTAASAWIHHAWLFDLLLYGLAALAGGIEQPAAGVVLVGFKALLVVALAWVLVQIRRPGLSLWAPVFCAVLALLAASHGLELHPRVVSMLFLAITVFVLVRSRTAPVSPPPNVAERGARHHAPCPTPHAPRAVWLLPPLFALWANLDSWFLLGPLAVGLFWLGEGFQLAFDPGRFGDDKLRPGELRHLFYVLLACVGACLLNPHHLRGFALPDEWAWGTLEAVRQADPYFLRNYSPWEAGHFRVGGPGRSLAGTAYYVLLFIGIVSFLLNQGGWRWSRAFLWIGFTLLSFNPLTLLGFSAVVLGPMAALNLQDFAARRFGLTPFTDPNGRAWSLGGRAFTALLVAVLIACAWPGWLHALPTDLRHERRVAWRVSVDTSLRDAARQLAAWRDEGLWSDEQHGFLFHPDVAHYCAWFAPREKGFFDHRYALFGGPVAGEFMKVRQTLRGLGGKPPGPESRRLQEVLTTACEGIFRQRKIAHVALHLNETEQLPREDDEQRSSSGYRVTQWLTAQPGRWILRHLGGRTLVFSWHDPPQVVPADPARAGYVDLNQRAFGRDLTEGDKAPAEGPERGPRRQSPWERFLHGPALTPPGLAEAARYLDHFELSSQLWPMRVLAGEQWAYWTAAVGSLGGGGGTVLAAGTMANLTHLPPALRSRGAGHGPPAAPLLAVRAARRAVAANPDLAAAYLELARAYETLWRTQEGAWMGQALPPGVRQFQTVGALRQYLALRPEEAHIHRTLGSLHDQLGQPDLAAEHFREWLTLVRRAGPRPPVTAEQFQKALDGEDKKVQQLEALIQKQRNEYLVAASGQPIRAKVKFALEAQLVKDALHVLMTADPKDMGPPEVELLVQLLFATGRLEEVREVLQPALKASLGLGYDRHRMLLAACLGNYREAALYLDEAISQVSKRRRAAVADALQTLSFVDRVHGQPGGWVALFSVNWDARKNPKLAGVLQGPLRYGTDLAQEAELSFLRGLLALEEGATDAAEEHLRHAVDLAAGGAPLQGRAVAARYLKLLQDARR